MATEAPVPLDLQLDFDELANRYAMSSFGRFHAEQDLRYSAYYDYGRDAMLFDLGDDVHPVRHMRYTERAFMVPLLEQYRDESGKPFSIEEIAVGRVAAILHDIGECEHPEIEKTCGSIVGDVPYQDKSNIDDGQESIVRGFLYAELFDDIPVDTLALAESIIKSKDGSALHRAFAAAESLGYITTAFNAARIALAIRDQITDEVGEVRFQKLARLGVETGERLLSHPAIGIHLFAEEFTPVASFLEDEVPQLEQAMQKLSDVT